MSLLLKRMGLFILLLLVSHSLSSQNLSFDLSYFQYQRDSIIQSKIGTPFLDFSATSVNGKIISEKQLQGKVTLINFWFAGCTPCIAEFDALNDLYDKFKDHPSFQFLSLTFDPEESVRETRLKYDIPYDVSSIKREECHRLNFDSGFPTSIIVDRQGKIVFIKYGGSTDPTKAAKAVEQLDPIILNLLENYTVNPPLQ
jgi:peroxiredoxin